MSRYRAVLSQPGLCKSMSWRYLASYGGRWWWRAWEASWEQRKKPSEYLFIKKYIIQLYVMPQLAIRLLVN